MFRQQDPIHICALPAKKTGIHEMELLGIKLDWLEEHCVTCANALREGKRENQLILFV